MFYKLPRGFWTAPKDFHRDRMLDFFVGCFYYLRCKRCERLPLPMLHPTWTVVAGTCVAMVNSMNIYLLPPFWEAFLNQSVSKTNGILLIEYRWSLLIFQMVLLHVKRGDESQFLYETNLSITIEQLAYELVSIYNGRLKVSRVCSGK